MATNQTSSTESATSFQPTTVSPSNPTSLATKQNHTTPAVKDIFHAIKRNNLPAVKQFIEEKGELVTRTDAGKKNVALIAAEYGHLPILKYLLEKNSTLLTVPDMQGNTVLQSAIQRGDFQMVKYLVDEKKADILAIDHLNIHTAVHVAALEGQLEILKYFIEKEKADANLRNLNGETLLFAAAEKPYIYVVMYLVEDCHAEPTLLDSTKNNVLFTSAKHGDVSVPKYLLDTKKIQFDVNWKNDLGYTALNWASRFNNTEFVEYMVTQKKADVTMPDTKMIRTPLHLAAAGNNFGLCKFLVDHGAKPDAKDTHGHIPAQLATEPELVSYLNSTTSSNRKRRSLTMTIEIPRQEVPTMKNRMGNIYPYQFLVSSRGNNQVTAVQQGTTTNAVDVLNGFLTVVNAAARYLLGSVSYPRVDHQLLQTPQEYLDSRVDPDAVHSVNELPFFEE